MADKRISELSALSTPASGDLIPIVDISEANNALKNKTIRYGDLVGVWTDWTPTQTGWTALPTGTYRYCLIGKTCLFNIAMTAGTSNATSASLVLPFTSANFAGAAWGGTNNTALDNNTALTVATRWNIVANSNVIIFYKDSNTGTWTASSTKRIYATGFYEIA